MDEENNSQGSRAQEKIAELGKEQAKKRVVEGLKKQANKALKKGVKEATKKAATSKLKLFLLKPLLFLLGFLLILIFVVGLVVGLVYIVGSMQGKLEEIGRGIWNAIASLKGEREKTLDGKDFAQMADYLESRGYDLYNEGFIYDEHIVERGNEKRKNDDSQKEGVNRANIVNITERSNYKTYKTHAIEEYTKMDFYTKNIRNKTGLERQEQSNYSYDMYNDTKVDDFPGMLLFSEVEILKNQPPTKNIKVNKAFSQSAITSTVSMDYEKKELTITGSRFFRDRILGLSTYKYDTDGWVGRYGMPLEFCLALHVGTRAPDLVMEMIRGTEARKKNEDKPLLTPAENVDDVEYFKPILHIGLVKQERFREGRIGKENFGDFENSIITGGLRKDEVYKDVREKVPDAKKEEIDSVIKEITRRIDESKYQPILLRTYSHWFRNVYFYMDPKNEDSEEDDDLRSRNTDAEYVVQDKDYYLTTGESWSKYDISNKDGKEIRTPKTQKVEDKWQAYKINAITSQGPVDLPFEGKDKQIYDALKEVAKVEINATKDEFINVEQVEEGRRGPTNARVKNLFAEQTWYKYDGGKEKADKNNKEREKVPLSKHTDLKSLVGNEDDLLAGMEILEGTNTLDAQYILKDLKEFYVELGYFKKEDLRDPVRKVLQWPIPEYSTPKFWPRGNLCKDPDSYGAVIPSKSSVDAYANTKEALSKKLEEKKKNNEGNGEGFEPGKKVVSPVTGRIIDQGTSEVLKSVILPNGQKKMKKIQLDYIAIKAVYDTTEHRDLTEEEKKDLMPEEYREFYENEYKGVISGKEKFGENRAKIKSKGNVIIIQGIKVDANNSESHYRRQITESDIKKIQNPDTRNKAESIEQKKISAPSRIGEFIKEGTVIGTTTENDIRIVMKDSDKAFIENVQRYIVPEKENDYQNESDFSINYEPTKPNTIRSVKEFREMFATDRDIANNAEMFLKIQQEYNIDAFVLASTYKATKDPNKTMQEQVDELVKDMLASWKEGDIFISDIIKKKAKNNGATDQEAQQIADNVVSDINSNITQRMTDEEYRKAFENAENAAYSIDPLEVRKNMVEAPKRNDRDTKFIYNHNDGPDGICAAKITLSADRSLATYKGSKLPPMQTKLKSKYDGPCPGHCTDYANDRIASLGVDLKHSAALGNGCEWVSTLSSLGCPTGNRPTLGAVCSQKVSDNAPFGHVMVVENCWQNGDGTYTMIVSEANYVDPRPRGSYDTGSFVVSIREIKFTPNGSLYTFADVLNWKGHNSGEFKKNSESSKRGAKIEQR